MLLARSGNEDAKHPFIGIQLIKCIIEIYRHLQGDGVRPLGPIQANDAQWTAALNIYWNGFHRRLSNPYIA